MDDYLSKPVQVHELHAALLRSSELQRKSQSPLLQPAG